MIKNSIMQMVGSLYDKSTEAVPALADEYLKKHDFNVEAAATAFVKEQTRNCAAFGFVSGLGGLTTMLVTLPANIVSVTYVQMRMITCLAHMAGLDIKSESVRSDVYLCLMGTSLAQPLKKAGKKMAEEATKKLVAKLAAKIGGKSAGYLGRAIPFVGGAVGGAFDYLETKLIAKLAYNRFITNRYKATPQGTEEAPTAPEALDAPEATEATTPEPEKLIPDPTPADNAPIDVEVIKKEITE